MKKNHLPKSVLKAIRYIKQDAPPEKLRYIRKTINYAINKREKELHKMNS
jgi:hypothetical protein